MARRRHEQPPEEERTQEEGEEEEQAEERYDYATDEDSELASLLADAKKRYGDVAIRGNQKKQPLRISTGVFILDLALLGGIPEGRMSQLVGEKGAGKSTMALKIIANAQAEYPDHEVVLLDIEQTFDPVWAEKLGVRLDQITVLEAETGEMAVDIADGVLGSKETSLLAIDSLAAMIPYKEAKASAEDDHMALQSRLIGELCRKIVGTTAHQRLRDCNPTVLFINQYRTDIRKMFGDNRTVPGGRAMDHFPTLNLRLKNAEKIGTDENDVEVVLFNEHEFAITKWKVNNGPRTGAFRLCRIDEEEHGLQEGDIDNASTMCVYAKKFGFWSGGGKNQKLEFDEWSLKFGKMEDGRRALNEDVDLYFDLYNALLREQAISRRMPSDFIARFL